MYTDGTDSIALEILINVFGTLAELIEENI